MTRQSLTVLLLSAGLLLACSCAGPGAFRPRRAPATPTVTPPRPGHGPVLHAADFGALPGEETCAWRPLAAALAACRARGASALVLTPGRYHFRDPAILEDDGGHLLLENLADLVIDGRGAELVFHHVRPGIRIRNSQRLLVKNLVIDWGIRLASAAVAEDMPGVGRVLRFLDEFPVGADTPLDERSAVSEFDLAAGRWVPAGRESYFPREVVRVAPQVFTSPSFAAFPPGRTFVVRHHVYSAHAVDFGGPGNEDLSFEDITIYASPGHNFVGYGAERGFRFTRCRIARRDEPGRLISGASDGIHIGSTRGEIIIEDCEFSLMGDDSVNIHGAWMRVAGEPADREVVLSSRWFWAAIVDPGDELKFCGAADLEEYGRALVRAVEVDHAAQVRRVIVDRDLPARLAGGDYVANLSRASPGFVIRGNTFRDHRARGMLIQARDGLIENNRVSRVTAAALQMTTDADYWQEGFGCENIIVRDNVFEGCNYAAWERGARGRHMAAVNLLVVTTAGLGAWPVHRDIIIENNTIRDTPGLAFLVTSSRNVVIRGNRVSDSNTEPPGAAGSAIDAPATGALMVTRARDVVIADNVFSGAAVPDPPVFIDRRNTVNVSEHGNIILPLPGGG